MRARRLIGWTAPLGVVAAFVASQTVAMAYPAPPSTAKVTSGCSDVTQSANCGYVFQFLNSSGTGVDGLTVSFVLDPVSGCSLSPTSAATSGGGFVSTTLTCASNASGSGSVVASNSTVSASAAVSISPANAGGGGGSLPFTSTNPPGPSGWLIAALSLAAVIVVGGASYLTVNRRRRTTA